MDDSSKAALVAIACSNGLTTDEAWTHVDRIVEERGATDLRELSRLVADSAAAGAWDHDPAPTR